MPIKPNLLERLVLFRLNKGPAPILDLFGAAGLRAVALALDLDLFEVIADADRSPRPATIADRTETDVEGIDRLCAYLVPLGYLARQGDGYRLTAMTERWLLDDAETNLGPFLTFWTEIVLPFWEGELETAVRKGRPSRTLYEWLDDTPGKWPVAQAGFRSTASLIVDDVVSAVSVPEGARRAIDIGGGHGLYAVELCRRHPELAATVFDVPGAIDAIEDDVPEDVADRVDTRAGDYEADDLGEGFDLAFLFNVVHAHDPAGNMALLRRAGNALSPGGRLVVLDQWAGSGRSPVGRAGLRFVALTYLVTLGADVYDTDTVESWLREAGFVDVNRTGVGPLSGMAIIEATKPEPG